MTFALVGMDILCQDIVFLGLYDSLNAALSRAERELNTMIRHEYAEALDDGEADIDFQDYKIVLGSDGNENIVWKVFAIEQMNGQKGEALVSIDLDGYEQILKNVINVTLEQEKTVLSAKEILRGLGYKDRDFIRLGFNTLMNSK